MRTPWQRFKHWMGTWRATAVLMPLCLLTWLLFFVVWVWKQ